MADAQHTPPSSISSVPSPRFSLWSKEHSAKSSASSTSITSSSVQTRDSLDLFGTQKRLEDVREEEDFPPRQICSFDEYRCDDVSRFSQPAHAHAVSSNYPGYSLADQDVWSTTSSSRQSLSKRIRSAGRHQHSVAQRFASRFGSLSRRWRNRSTVGPRLSIITNTTPIASPRASLDPFANHHGRSTSVASTANDIYSPASMHSFVEEPIPESEVVPIYIDRLPDHSELEEERGLASTPLLPPTMLNLHKQESPIQSPLQSPSIAPTTQGQSSKLSIDKQPLSYLPSPPLSTRPSLASMPRSRTNTATQDIPTLQQLEERFDPWAAKLGHADFSIYPEPYRPNVIDLDSYKEFRDNWEYARKQYAQHLARTIEHYGDTSKVYRLTEQKWSSIDRQWKEHDASLNKALTPQLQRLSDGPPTPNSPVSLLEKPVSRVVMPQLDQSGKFPEIGDTDIVGPLTVAAAKVPELQRGAVTPPLSPRKRNFIKALGDMFRH